MSIISGLGPSSFIPPRAEPSPSTGDGTGTGGTKDASQTQTEPKETGSGTTGEPSPVSEDAVAGSAGLSRADSQSVLLAQDTARLIETLNKGNGSELEIARRLAEATLERLRQERLAESLTEARDALLGPLGPVEGGEAGTETSFAVKSPAQLAEAQRVDRSV